MNNNSDIIIWKEFKNGKDDALSFIYHQNIDFLFFYGKKFTTDEALILDVIQDLFFYLIQKRNTLGDTENIRMYLLKSFRRSLFIELRKKEKLQKFDDTGFEPEIVFSVEENLIIAEEQSEKSLELKRGMQMLNQQQREILYYKFTCNFDYNQICEIMSISYDSARQIVSRSIQSLKKYLTLKVILLMIFFTW
ncbi:sigma-70 family RNA polymerase sigma factor [Draconibacterium sp.]